MEGANEIGKSMRSVVQPVGMARLYGILFTESATTTFSGDAEVVSLPLHESINMYISTPVSHVVFVRYGIIVLKVLYVFKSIGLVKDFKQRYISIFGGALIKISVPPVSL